MDLVIFCVFAWCIAAGVKQGLFSEIFRLLGCFFTTVFALHFFPMCAQFLRKFIPIAPRYLEFFSYAFLGIFIIMSFKVMRDAMDLFRKVPEEGAEISSRSRMWGAMLGSVRAVLVSGLIFTAVVILDHTPTLRASQASFSGKILFHVSPTIYKGIHNNVIEKLFPNEQINSKLFRRFEDVKYLHKKMP
ncbi:MAG TPA: CvpA family protein [Candidatus Omnitrophota bacterium]|nr:CvpA family protein [Candidatus Omnitrophota bacterium]